MRFEWSPLTTQEKVAMSEAYKNEDLESLIDAVSDALYLRNEMIFHSKVEELRSLVKKGFLQIEKAMED